MRFSDQQKQRFIEDGYVVIPNAVPRVMVDAARQAINHYIGQHGMPPDELEMNRAQTYCRPLTQTDEIVRLFNDTPVFDLTESLLGAGKVSRASSGQIGLRFPAPPFADAAPPRGHLDGIGSGKNGSNVGEYHRGFTGFAVVYLSDVPAAYCGNFTVWPGSHLTVEQHLEQQGVDVLTRGCPQCDWPRDPVQVVGRAGDAVIAHHQLIHTAAPNTSANIRYGIIFRLRHVDCGDFANKAYTDIWHEWEGLHHLLPPERASRTNTAAKAQRKRTRAAARRRSGKSSARAAGTTGRKSPP